MTNTAHGRSRGYTLTELMLVVAIVGVVGSVGGTIMVNLQNFYLLTTARNEIERDARNSLDIINRFLRQAKVGTIVVDTPDGQGPYSRVSFSIADDRQVSFWQSGTSLMQSITSGSSTNSSLLSKNVVYIAFTFPRTDDPTIISVSMTMGKAIQQGKRKVLELTIQKVRIMNP